MKGNIITSFLLITLLTTTVTATSITPQNTLSLNISENTALFSTRIPQYHPTLFDWGVDQQHTENCGHGIILTPPWTFAQSFIPTKNKLTAVRLHIFKYGTPPAVVHLTVSIRDNLTGSDLTSKTIDTSLANIPKNNWILFDFQDIPLTPGDTYYILCSGDGGNDTNAWCWFYNNEDTYTNGEAWVKPDEYSLWSNFTHGGFNPDDFCFKTYFRKPFGGSVPLQYENPINPLILSLHERFPHAFPILRHTRGY
jgi:hypothetical protein